MHTPCAGFSKTGARYRVPGIGYRLSGTWDLVPGTGAESTPRAGYRAPRTEPNAHTGYAGCRIEMARIRITGYPEPGTWHLRAIPTEAVLISKLSRR
jgi:hypothetical protein